MLGEGSQRCGPLAWPGEPRPTGAPPRRRSRTPAGAWTSRSGRGATGRALPRRGVRLVDDRVAAPDAAPDGRGLDHAPAMGARRRPLRLPGARAVGPGARPPLRPRRAARRPLRASDRPAAWSVVVDGGFDWGADAPPRVPWADTVALRAARARLHQAPPCGAGRAARHLRRPRPPRLDRPPHSTSASPRSSCCRCTSSRSEPALVAAGWPTTGATTRSASSRRTRPTRRAGHAASRCTSSRPWSGRCTRPGSRSCSTSSTTTPARAAPTGRRSAGAAWTTRPTTGCATTGPSRT